MAIQPPAGADDDGTAIGLGARWQFGCFELNEKRGELRRDGVLVKIETKPLNLLMLFVRHPGELITKNDLVNALWPGGVASDAMLGGCVGRLRTALGDDGSDLIRNVFGHGYRFDAEVKLVGQEVHRAPPKVEFQRDDTPPLRPNWRLVRRLGLSGDCWLAEHVKTRQRRVFKFSNEPAGLAALKREVTIYRLLRESLADRPCYVDLLDWNFDAAPWFIESEYCAGGSLQEWFTAQGGIDRVPLSTRIDLMIQIAEAVAEVHAVGVLHKDLKPANVFVVFDANGRPGIRLADFGASTLHDSAFLQRLEITRAGFTQVLDGSSQSGTLLYLAPEVVAGQPATIKADIYALGLMLYQLVAGALGRQLSTGWEAEIDDELLREDIAAATDGNPERRLSDAGELARRLRMIEQRRSAREAERVERLRAEARARQLERARLRRWWLTIAAASMVLGLIGTTLFAIQANDARRAAEVEAARARAVGEFLAGGMFSEINSEVQKVGDMTVKDLLDRAAARMPTQFESAPDTQRDLHLALARAYSTLGYVKESDAEFAAADGLVVQHDGPNDERRLEIASKWITVSFALGRLKDNVRRFDSIAEQTTPKSDAGRNALKHLRGELVRARLFLGQSDLARQGALALLADSPDTPDAAEAWRSLGLAQFKLMEVHDARKSLEKALALRRTVADLPTRRLVPLLCNLAYAEIESGLLDEAGRHLDEADAISHSWFDETDGWRIVITGGRALLAHHRGQSDAAVQSLRSALELSRRSDARVGSIGNSEILLQLAQVLNDAGRYREASAALDELLPASLATLAADSLDLVRFRYEQVRALQGLGDPQAAATVLEAVHTVLDRKALPADHPLMLQLAVLEAAAAPPVVPLAAALYVGHPSLAAGRSRLSDRDPR